MMQHTLRDAEGTLTYVSGTGTLFLKVPQGWKEIQVQPRVTVACRSLNPMWHHCEQKICNHTSAEEKS